MNVIYDSSMATPIHRLNLLGPNQTVRVNASVDPHITASSGILTLSPLSMPDEPETMTIPQHNVRRKMLLPAVVATRMPMWPRRPLMTAMNFSGSVVEIASMV